MNHPLDILQGYRLGSRQATTELQRTDVAGIHIEFQVFKLVEDIKNISGQAIILTGTAGDGKTYLAYRIMEAMGLDRKHVLDAQRSDGYDQDGIFIDLDLSAGMLTESRVNRLYAVLSNPEKVTLICVNEGKLAEVEDRFAQQRKALPQSVICINLSNRALVNRNAWEKVLDGILDASFWGGFEAPLDESLLAWNRAWLRDPDVKERLRCYLLLPYLLGEPITIRETLSFLAYALGSNKTADTIENISTEERIRHMLFNTLFSEPEGYTHGERAAPTEKLLWWLYRFDPADTASPEVDLRLLVDLDKLQATPPKALLDMWKKDLVVREGESDASYRQRQTCYMHYARRWYTLASDEGFRAYFPFQHFEAYLKLLEAPLEEQKKEITSLIKGINLLLSGGRVNEQRRLQIFYFTPERIAQGSTIYSPDIAISYRDFRLETDLSINRQEKDVQEQYLERYPRRLYLVYTKQPDIRLPISLLLYEVLQGAVSPSGGFPATLWAKERDTVARFMAMLSKTIQQSENNDEYEFTILLSNNTAFQLTHMLEEELVEVR